MEDNHVKKFENQLKEVFHDFTWEGKQLGFDRVIEEYIQLYIEIIEECNRIQDILKKEKNIEKVIFDRMYCYENNNMDLRRTIIYRCQDFERSLEKNIENDLMEIREKVVINEIVEKEKLDQITNNTRGEFEERVKQYRIITEFIISNIEERELQQEYEERTNPNWVYYSVEENKKQAPYILEQKYYINARKLFHNILNSTVMGIEEDNILLDHPMRQNIYQVMSRFARLRIGIIEMNNYADKYLKTISKEFDQN